MARPASVESAPVSARGLLAPHASAVGARRAFRRVGLPFAGSLLIAASAQVTVPMVPVPVTLQTFAVLFVAMALGRAGGVAAVALYLLEGAAGLPVFAGGVGGAARLVGPTAGYLAGFLIAAAVVGTLSDRGWGRRFGLAFPAMLLGDAVILFCGAMWLALSAAAVGGDAIAAWSAGSVPFVGGALVKSLAAAALIPGARRALRTR